MKDLGSGIKAFKKGFDSEEDEIDVETEVKKIVNSKRKKVQPNKKVARGMKQNDKSVIKSVRKNAGKVDNATKKESSVKKKNKSGKKNNKN